MAGLAEKKITFEATDDALSRKAVTFDATDALNLAPPSERYDASSNSVVTTPNNFSDPSVSRESMEFIEGQNGEQIYGGTNYLGFADFAEAGDIKKILAGASPIVSGVTGQIERKIELSRERRPLRPGSSAEDIEAFDEAIPTFLSGLVALVLPGQRKVGFQAMMEGVANFRQFAPFSLGFMSDERGLSPIEAMVQDNPEKAARLQAASKKARENTDEFLIEHGIMFGPDDEPTLVGTILQQASLTGSIMAVGMASKSPGLVMGMGFGAIQQGEGFLEAREAGKDVFEAATIGDIQGGIEFAMSSIEMGMVMKIVDNKSAGIAKKIAAGFTGEAVQESTTDTFLLAVSNLAGVKNMTLEQALQAVIQAGFYGGFAGGIATGSIASVQRIAQKIQESIDAEIGLIEDPADVRDATGEPLFDFLQVLEEAIAELEDEVSEQYISDIEVENQVDEDKASGAPVTKSAQSKGESQAKVAEILKKIESGEEFNVQEEFDKLEPEARKSRERKRLTESETRKAENLAEKTIRDTVKSLNVELEIAIDENDDEAFDRIIEEIDAVRATAIEEGTLLETIQQLDNEGLFVPSDTTFDDALAAVDDLADIAFEAGVRAGRTDKTKEIQALQKRMEQLVRLLGDKIDEKKKTALMAQIANVTSLKTAKSVRNKIVGQARRNALAKFVRERRKAISDIISNIAGKKPKGDLIADHQNTVDNLNKIRKGLRTSEQVAEEDRAPQVEPGTVQVKIEDAKPLKRTPEQQKFDEEVRAKQVEEFTQKEAKRLAKEMDEGIPSEGLMLQVRFLAMLQEKAKVSPQELARFEDDLNAYIATGLGKATAAEKADQALIDDTKKQGEANEVQATSKNIEDLWGSSISEVFNFLSVTRETLVRWLGLKGTLFDFFKIDIAHRQDEQAAFDARNTLADEVSDGGSQYVANLRKEVVIDQPREGLTADHKGQSKNIKWTRGKLINAWMMLQEPSIKEQLMNPDGRNGWTQEFVDLIDSKMDSQDIAYAEGLFEIYDNSYGRLNDEYRKIYNRDLQKVDRYSHITREGEGGIEASVDNETMFFDMLFQDKESKGISPQAQTSETKQRVPLAESEILVSDVNDVYNRYVYDVEHFISYAGRLRLIHKLLRDTEFTDHIKSIAGEVGLESLNNQMRLLSRQARDTKFYYQWFEFFRKNMLSAEILGKIKIGLGQMASQLAYSAGVPKVKFAEYSASFLSGFKKANDTLNQHPTFSSRELNFDSDIEQIGAKGKGKWFKRFSLPVRKGDLLATKSGAYARYRWLTEDRRMSHEDALNEVAEFAERSQQSTLPSQLTEAQQSSDPLVRAATMFHSSPTAMFNMSLQAVSDWRQSERTPEDKKALYDTLAIQNVVIPFLFATLSGRKVGATVAIGSAAGIPIAGDALTAMITVLSNMFDDDDDPVYADLLELPIEKVPRSVTGAATLVADTLEEAVKEGITESLKSLEWEDILRVVNDNLEVWGGIPADNVTDATLGSLQELFGGSKAKAAIEALGFEGEAVQLQLDRIDKILPGTQSGEEKKSSTSGRISQRTGAI